MIKKYEICYNDGALYAEVIFNNKSEDFIKEFFIEEIKSNNRNVNKNWHIGFNNIKKVEVYND